MVKKYGLKVIELLTMILMCTMLPAMGVFADETQVQIAPDAYIGEKYQYVIKMVMILVIIQYQRDQQLIT